MSEKILTEDDLIKQMKQDKQAARQAGKVRGFAKNSASVAGAILIQDSVSKVNTEESKEETEVKETANESVEEKKEETPAPTLDSIKDIVLLAVKNAVEPVKEELTQVQKEASEKDSVIESLKQEVAKKDSVIAEKETKITSLEKDVNVVADLNKLIGKPVEKNVNFNTKTSVHDEPQGLAKEAISIFESCKKVDNVPTMTAFGLIYSNQRDTRPFSQFVQQCFSESYSQGKTWRESSLVKDMESYFKAHGLLAGTPVTEAAGSTTGASGAIPNAFLDVLSAMMRETHNTSNIWWQFTTTAYDPTSAPSKNVLVPRFNYLADPTDPADFVIADTTTFNPIGLTIGTSSDSQGLEMTTVPIGIKQYGIGRGTAVGTRPVYIPEFHQARSLVPLMDAVDSRLMQNYYKFEELLIRLQYEASTKIVYNDNGNVTTAAGDVATGDDGTLTKEFLNALYFYMYSLKIPTVDGRYILCIPPVAATQLKNSLQQQYRPVTVEEMQNVTNALRAATGVEIGRASGYLGDYNNFHIFVGNTWGIGNAGDVPTVNNVAFNAGTYTCEDCFAFGVGAVGRGIASPMEIRSNTAPYGLGAAYIWVESSGVGAIDLDSALDSAQQTRVLKFRCSRTTI